MGVLRLVDDSYRAVDAEAFGQQRDQQIPFVAVQCRDDSVDVVDVFALQELPVGPVVFEDRRVRKALGEFACPVVVVFDQAGLEPLLFEQSGNLAGDFRPADDEHVVARSGVR